MDATLVRETLAGYAAANDVIEAERIEWLANLSDDEARTIDRSLYASWDSLPAWTRVGLERLEPLQLEGLLTIRQAFADLLDNPEITQRFEIPWQRIHTI